MTMTTLPRAVEVVAVPTTITPAGPAETAVVRLLSLLPADWPCTWAISVNGTTRLRLRIQIDEHRGAQTIRAAVAAAFQDNALKGWASQIRP